MLKVGITGGIGSGKTTIAEVFMQLGIPVYPSDIRAKELMSEDFELRQAIVDLFGNEAYVSENLNRAFIASKVFSKACVKKGFIWDARIGYPVVIANK